MLSARPVIITLTRHDERYIILIIIIIVIILNNIVKCRQTSAPYIIIAIDRTVPRSFLPGRILLL